MKMLPGLVVHTLASVCVSFLVMVRLDMMVPVLGRISIVAHVRVVLMVCLVVFLPLMFSTVLRSCPGVVLLPTLLHGAVVVVMAMVMIRAASMLMAAVVLMLMSRASLVSEEMLVDGVGLICSVVLMPSMTMPVI